MWLTIVVGCSIPIIRLKCYLCHIESLVRFILAVHAAVATGRAKASTTQLTFLDIRRLC